MLCQLTSLTAPLPITSFPYARSFLFFSFFTCACLCLCMHTCGVPVAFAGSQHQFRPDESFQFRVVHRKQNGEGSADYHGNGAVLFLSDTSTATKKKNASGKKTKMQKGKPKEQSATEHRGTRACQFQLSPNRLTSIVGRDR